MTSQQVLLGIALMAFAFFAVIYASELFHFTYRMPASAAAAVAVGTFYFLALYQGGASG